MAKLRVRFTGLCLHRKDDKEVDVLHAWPAHGQKSRDGKHDLTDHKPQLWIEGSMAPTTDRTGVAAQRCVVVSDSAAACRDMWIYELLPAESLSIVGGTSSTINWGTFDATSLNTLHPVSGVRKRPPAPSVTHFKIPGGIWSAGPRFPVKWRPSGNDATLALWQELEVELAANVVKIASAQGGWELPVANERVVWVTSFPMDPGHHSGHANHPATHFKWFYECVELVSNPRELEHPELLKALPKCPPGCNGAGGASNTTFCPDTQYP